MNTMEPMQGQTWGTATTAPPVNLLRIEEQLSATHSRLGSAYIERLDWKDCIKRYERPHSFFYLDPLYWETEGDGVPFPWAEYETMATMMRELKGKALLSINDHPDIQALLRVLQSCSSRLSQLRLIDKRRYASK